MGRGTVLVLGGGVAGQVAADRLGRHRSNGGRVVVVDRLAGVAFASAFPWVIAGRRRPAAVTRPLARLARRGVEIRVADITAIDLAGRTVVTSGGTEPFDKLLVALGAELAPGLVPGWEGVALNAYTLEGADQIHRALAAFSGGRIAIVIASLPFKCPAAPYEIAMLVRETVARRGLAATVAVYTPETLPMPTAGPAVGEALRGMLGQAGIEYHPRHTVAAVDARAQTLTFAEGATAAYDLLIGVPPHRAPAVIRDSGLAGPKGWIAVDRATMATAHPGIYAVGDATGIPLDGGFMLPKAGVFAHHQAEVAVANILAELDGRPPAARFDGHGWCAIETGGGKAGFGSGDFYAAGGPRVNLYRPARWWHWAKVLFERWWLWRWF